MTKWFLLSVLKFQFAGPTKCLLLATFTYIQLIRPGLMCAGRRRWSLHKWFSRDRGNGLLLAYIFHCIIKCIIRVIWFDVLHRDLMLWRMLCMSCCGCRKTGSTDLNQAQLRRTMSVFVGGWYSWPLWPTAISIAVMTFMTPLHGTSVMTWSRQMSHTTPCHGCRLSAIRFAASFFPEWIHATFLTLWLCLKITVDVDVTTSVNFSLSSFIVKKWLLYINYYNYILLII